MANKEIRDYALKTTSLTGDELLLIQDQGVTRSVKAQEFLISVDFSNYYTRAEVDQLLANLGEQGVTVDLADYYRKTEIDALLNNKANVNHSHNISNVANLQTTLDNKADVNHTHQDYATKAEVETLKQSVSDGKRLVADAITGKGITTSATDNFQTMANNINSITTGGSDVFYGSIIVNKSSVTVNNVETDAIKVKLSQRPSNNQVVTLNTSNNHLTLSLTTLTFTPTNWAEEQSVIISHNAQELTDHTGTITLTSPNVSDVTITVNVTNSSLIEYGAIVVSTTSLSFNKGEATAFTVKLDKAPTTNQTITIVVDDSNISLDKSGMTFSPTNYNVEQAVTVTSSVATTAAITLSSEGVASKAINVTVVETSSGGTEGGIEIVPSEENFSVNESNSYYLSYSFRGTIGDDEVKELTITCNDNKVDISPSYVTVRKSNINDSFYISMNIQSTSLASGRTATLTFNGDGFVTKTVSFTINNNNISGSEAYGNIVLDKTSISITDNESATIGVKLDSAPSANQLVNIAVNNGNTQIDKTGLTFTPSNYSTYQYVTVNRGQALASIASTSYNSVLTFSSNGVESKIVDVTITLSGTGTPAETYGEIVVSNSVLTINEGNSTTFSVRLQSAPSSNQTVNISVGSSAVATVSPSTLTFTSYNYDSYQTVTVNGIKDSTSYVDKSTQITLSSNNVSSKYLSLTVKNTDVAEGGGGDIGNDEEDNDTYLSLPDTSVRNLVPYLSTYYIKPTVKVGEEIILNYFVTDYYGRSYTNDSNFYNYKIIVKREGKSNVVARNMSAGDHSISLGSYSQEGTYHFSIVAVDQYGRYSHELFNYVRVRNADCIHTNVYNVDTGDLTSYNIKNNYDKEEKQYVTVSTNFDKIENDSQQSTVQSAIDNAYNSASVSSDKYKVFIPVFGASVSGDYKGKTRGWKCLKVKYGSSFNATTYLNECATNRQNLQRLINDKANAGYNKIVLPNGTYMIDNTPIDIPNGVTLDLGGATIKMCPITGNGALMVRMTDCTDTHLCNGTIEGDYFSHDYANSTSNSEWVSGVEMAGSCRYCSVHDLTIKNITGYGLQNSISSTSANGNTFYGAIKVGNLETGDIDRTTGQNISCTYRLRSNAVNIYAYQGNADFISMSIHLNYQGNEFNSWNYYMYFYDRSNNFIKAISAYQYRQVKIPTNAYYARIVILGERLKSNWELHYQFFRVPTHCEFKNVTIDNARCVGMAQGQMKDFLVQDCVITNSGQSSATCAFDAEDGWDGMQDAFYENFRIYDCPANGFLTCAGHNFVVNNMHSDAIYMWERTRWAVVKNSTFDKGCIIRGGGEANIVQHGVTRFYNNTVSAPDYSNYLFMTVAKNCTYQTAPKNGIMVNSTVNGSSVSRTVYNNDANNSITDDIGKMTDNIDYGQTGGQNISATGVSLNKTSLSLNLGSSEQLVATVMPTNATNQTVNWSTSASNIASVSSNGLVTGNGSGYATITVTTSDGNHQASCSVQVLSSSSGGGSGTTSYDLTVSSSYTITSGENTYITYNVSNTLPDGCSYEIRRYGSYWCGATLVSTNRVNANTNGLGVGTYDSLTLVILYNGSVIATSNTFTITINQGNVVESALLSPASCAILVGATQTFTLMNSSAAINNYYTANGKVTVISNTTTTITVRAEAVGNDYINVILSDGTSLSSSITVSANTSGGGSTGGGSTGGSGGSGGSNSDSETDANGLVIVKYPAIQKPKPTTWCALGDSITAGTGAGGSSYSYANVCANLAGVTAIYNYGIPGSCLCAGYNTALTEPGVETAFCNRFGEMADGDLITVLGSVNDHRADVKIGSPTSTDKNDFYGALYVLITGLKQKYPNGRIVFITPFKISGWNGTNMYKFSLQDFRNAIVTQCNRFQIEVVDLFSEEQFSWLKGLYQGWFYSYDYYHPTPQGHQAIAQWLQGQLFGDGSGTGSGGSGNGGSTGGTTTTYGNIVIGQTSYSMNENSNTTIGVKLDKAPSNNQTVYISTSGNVSTNTSSLTFTPSNYNTTQTFTLYSGYAGTGSVTLSSNNVSSQTISVSISSSSSSGGGSSSGSTSSGIANSSDTALTQQYSSSHEATPNIANPPTGGYNWKYAPRINPDGSFPNSSWNAFGHWMTTYKVEGASYYDNVGLLLQNPKAWIWNTQTNSWDVLSSDFEWGSWYVEDFWDDGNSTIANSVTWEAGVSGNHSTWVKIKQDSTTTGRCFHPWGYQKDWRSNSAWSNNGRPYIVTKIDFKLVKYDENGADNLSSAQLVVNSGGDWWSYVGATWQPDWSTNRDMCVGKYIKATRELKRAWATNLPQNWSHGLPSDTPRN